MADNTAEVEYADRACNSCRQRRVKCDKRLPACVRCEKLGRPCTGYDLERKFFDEGAKVRRKYDENFQSSDFGRVTVATPPAAKVNPVAPEQRINLPPIQANFRSNQPTIPHILSPPLTSTPNLPSIQPVQESSRASYTNPPIPTFGAFDQQSPSFNQFSSTPPQSSYNLPPSTYPRTNYQYAPTPPQPQDYAQNSHQEQTTAKLLIGKPEYAPSDLDSSVSVNEDYFDLDIDTYYSKGNNACGFIPGLPVILTDADVPETEDDFLANDFASVSGRSSVYDGAEGHRASRSEYSQKYLHEKTTELACLTRHFVQSISPSMDLFDLDTYFSRIVPLKAVQNVMLRSAMAAVAANQIGQMMANHSPLEDLQHLLPFVGENGSLQHTDWFYKAANYYDRGISYLRIFLSRWLSDTGSEGVTGHASRYQPGRTLSEASTTSTLAPAPSNKRRRISRGQTSEAADMEALVAAISVFSLYESLDNFADDWSQHLDGFKALLESKILPQAVLSLPRPRADPFISMKAGRAAFWNFARADYLAAYVNNSKTRLDADNLTMWKAAGLPVTDDGTLNYNDPSTPINAIVSYQPGDREDLVACTLIWIVLRTMNFIAPQDDASSSTTDTPSVFGSPAAMLSRPGSQPSTPSAVNTRLARWRQLRRQLEDWYDNLPFTFQPYAIAAAGAQLPSDLLPDGRPRFARLFFSVPMCAAALQLYHFAQILLLLNQPVDEHDARNPANRLRMFRKVAEESEHHSRQICGIALGRPPPAVSRQMVHSLYLAGSCFEENEDRTVVIELLGNIAKETGSPTAHRVRELKEQWGWRTEPKVQEVA